MYSSLGFFRTIGSAPPSVWSVTPGWLSRLFGVALYFTTGGGTAITNEMMVTSWRTWCNARRQPLITCFCVLEVAERPGAEIFLVEGTINGPKQSRGRKHLSRATAALAGLAGRQMFAKPVYLRCDDAQHSRDVNKYNKQV